MSTLRRHSHLGSNVYDGVAMDAHVTEAISRPAQTRSPARESAIGLAFALAAFGAWGVNPIYFNALRSVSPLEIIAHRVLWSVLVVAVLVHAGNRWRELKAAVAPGSGRAVFLLTSVLISINWLVFIWATHNDRLLDASLGYFINPLVNVVLGVVVLRERLTRVQAIAVALAALGVLNQVWTLGIFPWISLALALSFGTYGLLRKRVAADSTVGLFIETLLLAPVALGYLIYLGVHGALAFGDGPLGRDALLAASGVVTAFPLLWFVAAARRLRLATLGLVQYVAPTAQFVLAVALYGERFTAAHAITFGLIWISLALYSASALNAQRARAAL
ncbi:MAG TPA: EamA family transporter RarD [Myxococcaceae bacterium]|nr:EamA family transporter RarD [Myxococcaceae bacterium]